MKHIEPRGYELVKLYKENYNIPDNANILRR